LTASVDNHSFAADWSLPTQSPPSVQAQQVFQAATTFGAHFGGALYSDFLTQGLSHFFPAARLEADGSATASRTELVCDSKADGRDDDRVRIEWLGQRYTLRRPGRSFTEAERRLIQAIGRVLTARYQALFNPDIATKNFHLFRGLPEDRHVSAFLDPALYTNLEALAANQDRIADAIEALRSSSLTTYENRRVSTGVLLLGKDSKTARSRAAVDGALRYSSALTVIRSFSRLCDGIQTVALADAQGRWIDIIDLERWAGSAPGGVLPLLSPSVYVAHCRATLATGGLCLVLTPNGEIKAFGQGVQLFSFLNGRWRLTDLEWKHRRWIDAVRHEGLANLVLQVGLDLAEARHGGLFVILDSAESARHLVAPGDLLDHHEAAERVVAEADSKRSVYYLLRGKRTENLTAAVLRTLATIDGGILLDERGRLLAFGAIFRNHNDGHMIDGQLPEGGRSAAALAASHFGRALKVSEDGIITFFDRGRLVWEI
jgi:hypothetical protein